MYARAYNPNIAADIFHLTNKQHQIYMKKHYYIVPDTISELLQLESLLCQSTTTSIEDLITSDDEFDMF